MKKTYATVNQVIASTKWVIRDWAGNYPFEANPHQGAVQLGGKPVNTFDSQEDAWDFIMDKFPNEEDHQEYVVVEAKVEVTANENGNGHIEIDTARLRQDMKKEMGSHLEEEDLKAISDADLVDAYKMAHGEEALDQYKVAAGLAFETLRYDRALNQGEQGQLKREVETLGFELEDLGYDSANQEHVFKVVGERGTINSEKLVNLAKCIEGFIEFTGSVFASTCEYCDCCDNVASQCVCKPGECSCACSKQVKAGPMEPTAPSGAALLDKLKPGDKVKFSSFPSVRDEEGIVLPGEKIEVTDPAIKNYLEKRGLDAAISFDDVTSVKPVTSSTDSAVEAARDEVKDLLIALNSSNDLGFKYPIGNQELTEKVKDLEAKGKIHYDDQFRKWNKGKAKASVEASSNEYEVAEYSVNGSSEWGLFHRPTKNWVLFGEKEDMEKRKAELEGKAIVEAASKLGPVFKPGDKVQFKKPYSGYFADLKDKPLTVVKFWTAKEFGGLDSEGRLKEDGHVVQVAEIPEIHAIKTRDLQKVKKVKSALVEATQTEGTPAIYVGTYGKYNSGSLKGLWMNLEDYADKDEFLDAAKKFHKDEEDPELMIQDFENFPKRFYNEGGLNEGIWEWLELDAEDRDILEAYMEARGESDLDIKEAKDAYQGTYDSEKDWAIEHIDHVGLSDDELPHFLEMSDLDARLVAVDDVAAKMADMSEEEILEKADRAEEYEAALVEDKTKAAKILEMARDEVDSGMTDDLEANIKRDPVGYFMDELGFSAKDLKENNLFSIDYEGYVKNAKVAGSYDFVNKDGKVYVFAIY